MPPDPDAPSDDDPPVAALAGQFLHQRAPYRSPRPGRRIDELDVPGNVGDPGDAADAISPDHHCEEDEAG